MQNQFVVSPFFLDQPIPAAERLAFPDRLINKPALQGGNQLARMSVIHRGLSDMVFAVAKNGFRPVSLAGDCCTAIGVLAGLQRAGVNPILLWIDAHGDFNTWQTSPSGFIGGMPLAMIVGRGDQTLMHAVALTPLPEEDVILSDARDLDAEERASLRQSKVRHLTNVSLIPQTIPPDRPVCVHLDVDVLDPQEAPAMLYPVNGGPDLASLCEMVGSLAKAGRVLAASLTFWKLESDHDQRTERASMALFNALLGRD